jgi:hypothetical protein
MRKLRRILLGFGIDRNEMLALAPVRVGIWPLFNMKVPGLDQGEQRYLRFCLLALVGDVQAENLRDGFAGPIRGLRALAVQATRNRFLDRRYLRRVQAINKTLRRRQGKESGLTGVKHGGFGAGCQGSMWR